MCFAVAFYLRRFVKRFPFDALLNVFLVESLTVLLGAYREPDAVRKIAVMGECQDITARFCFI